jgi:heme-degrading monooxygenase HmoA
LLDEWCDQEGFMHVRLSRFAGLPPERIDATIEEFREQQLPDLEGQVGFEGVLVMLNRSSGQAAALTFWATEADLHASERLAARAREAAMASAQPEREPVVDRYEVVFQK